jgi:hypothetical protein
MEMVSENLIVQLTGRGCLPKKTLGLSSWVSVGITVNRLVSIPVSRQWGSAKLNNSTVKYHAQIALLTAGGPVT